jgi:deazaflavin-dependent oxidoreductase (nitroreductase family)
MKVQIAVFRLTHGRLMASMRGMPVLLLTTIGRKTGKKRITPLMYIKNGDDYVITASNNGRDQHPAWFYNLQADPQVFIDLPGQQIMADSAIASEEEREKLWPILVSQAPFFDNYRKGTSRSIPMVKLKTI